MSIDEQEIAYKEEVEKSIAFLPQPVEFYTEVKARCLLEIAERRLGCLADRNALDIGCGIGLIDGFLVNQFRALHAVDISPSSIERASKANPSVIHSICDGRTLPFADGYFDLAFAINVLHHVPADCHAQFAKEMYRVLSPGGLAVIMEHNPYNPLTRLAVSRCSFDKGVAMLRMSRARALLDKIGLESMEERYILFIPIQSNVARRLEKGLGWLPLGAQYYIAGEKGNSHE